MARLDPPWSSRPACSNSPHLGFSVFEKDLDEALIGDTGRQSERWRYQCEDSMQARLHRLITTVSRRPRVMTILKSPLSPSHGLDLPNFGDLGNSFPEFFSKHLFDKVPECPLKGASWSTVLGRWWEFSENTLCAGARALVWSVRRLCRSWHTIASPG